MAAPARSAESRIPQGAAGSGAALPPFVGADKEKAGQGSVASLSGFVCLSAGRREAAGFSGGRLGSCAYSCGPAATSALPASLPSYLAKFLIKREARSLAFSSQTEASA